MCNSLVLCGLSALSTHHHSIIIIIIIIAKTEQERYGEEHRWRVIEILAWLHVYRCCMSTLFCFCFVLIVVATSSSSKINNAAHTSSPNVNHVCWRSCFLGFCCWFWCCCNVFPFKNVGAAGVRTRNLLSLNQTLFRLSYSPFKYRTRNYL